MGLFVVVMSGVIIGCFLQVFSNFFWSVRGILEGVSKAMFLVNILVADIGWYEAVDF